MLPSVRFGNRYLSGGLDGHAALYKVKGTCNVVGCQSYIGNAKSEFEGHQCEKGGACRTTSYERPCFFQIELPVLWE